MGLDDATSESDESTDEEAEQPVVKRRKSEDGDDPNKAGLKQQCVTALRKIRMGLQLQAEGTAILEAVTATSPLADLSVLLASVKEQAAKSGATTPIKLKTHTGDEIVIKGEELNISRPASPSSSGTSTPSADAPHPIWLRGSRYKCSVCAIEKGSLNGIKSHIMKHHTGGAVLCTFCDWSTTNPDSLTRHIAEKHA